jgi:fatty acid synthase subunit alpha, fungi type
MAKRTVEAKFATKDMSRSIIRQFLFNNRDNKDIGYEYDSPSDAPLQAPGDRKEAIPTPAPMAAKPESVQAQAEAPSAVPSLAAAAVSMPDIPLTAKDVVQSLVAHKLKKGFDEILTSKSIKELSAGMRIS